MRTEYVKDQFQKLICLFVQITISTCSRLLFTKLKLLSKFNISAATTHYLYRDYCQANSDRIQSILEEDGTLDRGLLTISLHRPLKKGVLFMLHIELFLVFQLCSQNQPSFHKMLISIFISSMKLALDRLRIPWEIFVCLNKPVLGIQKQIYPIHH